MWQPIETIPKNEIVFDLWAEIGEEIFRRIPNCLFKGEELFHIDIACDEVVRLPLSVTKPIAWMSLPEPPKP